MIRGHQEGDTEQLNTSLRPKRNLQELLLTPELTVTHIALYDITGRLVLSKTNDNNFSFDSLPAGLYFFVVHTNKGQQIRGKLAQGQ